MQVYFVAVEKPVSVDDILSFLERERIRCHPDAADRFTFDQRGAHYLNKDTGAQFAFLRTGPAGDRLAIHLSIPPLAPAFFAREAADELDALTKTLPIHLAESGPFERARFLALHSDLHWAAHVRCAARKESRLTLSESTLEALWSWNTKFDAACEWVTRNTEISEPTLAFVLPVLHPDVDEPAQHVEVDCVLLGRARERDHQHTALDFRTHLVSHAHSRTTRTLIGAARLRPSSYGTTTNSLPATHRPAQRRGDASDHSHLRDQHPRATRTNPEPRSWSRVSSLPCAPC